MKHMLLRCTSLALAVSLALPLASPLAFAGSGQGTSGCKVTKDSVISTCPHGMTRGTTIHADDSVLAQPVTGASSVSTVTVRNTSASGKGSPSPTPSPSPPVAITGYAFVAWGGAERVYNPIKRKFGCSPGQLAQIFIIWPLSEGNPDASYRVIVSAGGASVSYTSDGARCGSARCTLSLPIAGFGADLSNALNVYWDAPIGSGTAPPQDSQGTRGLTPSPSYYPYPRNFPASVTLEACNAAGACKATSNNTLWIVSEGRSGCSSGPP